jgi:glutamyl/glutaminyl-tRNA synthetase
MPCKMQEMHKGKLYICYTRSSEHQLKKQTTHKAHKRPAPRGEAKGLDTTGKRAKKQKTHKLPLNTCTRAKEHTKLTLSTHDRAKSKMN